MKQARRGLGGWRLTLPMAGLVSLLLVALPAQAGLGDLLDDLLDPVEDVPVVGEIVDPLVEDVIGPIVDDIVEPVGGDLIDPIADQLLAPLVTPIVDAVVTPIVDELVAPVVDNVIEPVVDVIEPVIEPVVETIPPVVTTTTSIPVVLPTDQEVIAGISQGLGVSPTGYPGGVLIADSNPEAGPVSQVTTVTTGLQSLQAALALQTALVDSDVPGLSNSDAAAAAEMEMIDASWLDGLTNWLRSIADGLLHVLALPVRLLELLARALLTAGSGLIAPLSMLLAFTSYLIKDRRWARAPA